jgi:hypothetical protein
MPAIDRHLARGKHRTGVVADLDDFEHVAGSTKGKLRNNSTPHSGLRCCKAISNRILRQDR